MSLLLSVLLRKKSSRALADITYDEHEDNSIPSLKDLCSTKLVSNVSLLHHAHITIPSCIKLLLMNKAINESCSRSIEFLLKSWPYKKLCVPLPKACQSHNVYLLYELEKFPQMIACTSLILQNFIQPLSTLKVLDLSAVPLIDSQISLICSLTTSEVSGNCNPEFSVYMNCLLDKRTSLDNLCHAFKAQKAGKSRIKLIVKTLHICKSFCYEELITLLCLLNPHELELLNCDYCYTEPRMPQIFSDLKKFHSLKALSLPSIGSLSEWKLLFNELVNLERIDLQNNQIKDELEYCLSGMYQKTHQCCSLDSTSKSSGSKLKFLNVACCSLTNTSILYLARSPHSISLSYLNLSFITNIKLTNLISLLRACKNLSSLELEECSVEESNWTPLFETLPSLNKLKYLNIALNVTNEYMLSVAPLIFQIPNLFNLRIKYRLVISYTIEPGSTYEEFAMQYKNIAKSTTVLKRMRIEICR